MVANTLVAILLATAELTGCTPSEADQTNQKDVQMKSVKIPVEGMSCGCARPASRRTS